MACVSSVLTDLHGTPNTPRANTAVLPIPTYRSVSEISRKHSDCSTCTSAAAVDQHAVSTRFAHPCWTQLPMIRYLTSMSTKSAASLANYPTNLQTMSQSHAHPQPSNYRIPGDILLQVFEELSGRSTGQWEPAPWTLAVVCRHWRDLVILSPALWSQLTFSPNNQPSSMLERFEVQLSRAGTCPLELKIDVVSVAPVDPQEALQTAFRLLVANIGRCTRLELGGQAPLCWSLASSIEGTPSLPILQSLSILHRSWISAPKGSPARSSQSPVRLFFRNTPSLRSIVLHGGNFLHPTFSQDFQLDNVERLILRHCHFDPASILPLLETSAPHLRELTIEHGSPLQHGSPEQAIELPQLRRVSLVHLYSEPPLMDHVR